MPIPILLYLGAGAVAAVGGGVMNLLAGSKEEEAKKLREVAFKKRGELIAVWNKTRDSFILFINDKKDEIQHTYEECRSRCQPIFDRYGHALGDVSDWPLPPGFEKIETMKITPPPPVKWTEWEKSETYKKANNDWSSMGNIINADIRNHAYGEAGGKAVALIGVKVFSDSVRRHNEASGFLTQMTNLSADNDKLTMELDGLTKTFDQMKIRAETLCGKLAGTRVFFEKYIGPCEGYLKSGRTRQELSDDEWKNIQYLARVRVALMDIARQPLT